MGASSDMLAIERRAFVISKWANLGMGLAGALAAWLSQSNAILVDGMFSLIGFVAAIIAGKVSHRTSLLPDRVRPYGYAADEAIFTAFRALSLLVLVLFCIANAGIGITDYVLTGEANELRYDVITVYFALIALTCASLWVVHFLAWRRTGKRSDMLRLEARAAGFDGLITIAAGAGLMGFPKLLGTPLAPLVPIGDNLVVIGLCALVVGRYWRDFVNSLGELAGVTARPEIVRTAGRIVRTTLDKSHGRIVDFAALKVGRRFDVIICLDAVAPMTAAQVDAWCDRLTDALRPAVGDVDVYLLLSQRARHEW